MFVIVNDNNVVLGPMRWNKFRFENFLFEELETKYELPQHNTDSVIIISDSIKIYPVQGTQDPEFNSKIELLHGPFWEFTNDAAISSYQVMPKTIDAVKNELKSLIANKRWLRENSQISVTLGNVVYKFNADREMRMILQNALTSNKESMIWKVSGDTWVTLNKNDIQIALTSILEHVQSCFDLEYTIVTQINNATSLMELDSISLSI